MKLCFYKGDYSIFSNVVIYMFVLKQKVPPYCVGATPCGLVRVLLTSIGLI